MKKVSRRMFLEAMLIGGGAAVTASALGAAGLYANAAGISGIKSDFYYLEQLVRGYTLKPKNMILADSHAHFLKIDDGNILKEVVSTISDKLDWQSISTFVRDDGLCLRMSYEDFSKALRSYLPKRFSWVMSDAYATVLHDHELEKDIALIRSQEVEAFNPENKSHEVHICLEGCDYVKDYMDARTVVEHGLKENAFVMINHPFAKPARIFKYWFPNRKEKDFLRKLALEYEVIFEGHNMINSLWMAASNGAATEFFCDVSTRSGKNIQLIANTDLHSADLECTKEQIGLSGTLFDKKYSDIRSLTGKEIIEKKKKLIFSGDYSTLKNSAGPKMVYEAMVKKTRW
ncbi:MAG: hypothetical protein ABIB71_09725 [Candidatus Woesearchaeota archaeon]